MDGGYDVGRHAYSTIDFSRCILPIDWDTSLSSLNIDDDLHTKLSQRINMQRTFDQQPLTNRICWQCGRVLWGAGYTKGSYMIDPPKGVRPKDAPANVFLKSHRRRNRGGRGGNCPPTFREGGALPPQNPGPNDVTNQPDLSLFMIDTPR